MFSICLTTSTLNIQSSGRRKRAADRWSETDTTKDSLMNKQEAAALLEQQLEAFRRESWAELVRRTDLDPVVFERAGTGTATYQLEIECVWDGPRGGNVRVIGLGR